MKNLHARFVLWLITPALRLRQERREEAYELALRASPPMQMPLLNNPDQCRRTESFNSSTALRNSAERLLHCLELEASVKKEIP